MSGVLAWAVLLEEYFFSPHCDNFAWPPALFWRNIVHVMRLQSFFIWLFMEEMWKYEERSHFVQSMTPVETEVTMKGVISEIWSTCGVPLTDNCSSVTYVIVTWWNKRICIVEGWHYHKKIENNHLYYLAQSRMLKLHFHLFYIASFSAVAAVAFQIAKQNYLTTLLNVKYSLLSCETFIDHTTYRYNNW